MNLSTDLWHTLLINFKSSGISFWLIKKKKHFMFSSIYRGKGGGGEGGYASFDLPLIIRRCQSLYNREKSAPSHVEYPRSLSSSLSTHDLMCL